MRVERLSSSHVPTIRPFQLENFVHRLASRPGGRRPSSQELDGLAGQAREREFFDVGIMSVDIGLSIEARRATGQIQLWPPRPPFRVIWNPPCETDEVLHQRSACTSSTADQGSSRACSISIRLPRMSIVPQPGPFETWITGT